MFGETNNWTPVSVLLTSVDDHDTLLTEVFLIMV